MNLALVIKKDTFDRLSKLRDTFHAETFDETITQLIDQTRK